MKQLLQLCLVALAIAVATGCSTKVERIDLDETRDLSGAWNDTDSRLVSEEMIGQMLDGRWLNEFRRERGGRPAVIVGSVRNLSHEHINTRTFINDIQRAMINSGEVEFVAAADERGAVREERADQDLHASEATRHAAGQERGANFMLTGTISTIIDANERDQVRYYQVDLDLISLADNRKVWVGQKKIRKFIERARLRH